MDVEELGWEYPFLRQALPAAGVAIGVVWVADFLVWPLGRRLSGSAGPSEDLEASSARLAVEVAMVLLALAAVERIVRANLAVMVPGPAAANGAFFANVWARPVTVLAGWVVLLVLKGDIALLCRPRGLPAQEPLPRARVLAPWLFLLALYIAVDGGASLVSWIATGLVKASLDVSGYAAAWELAAGVCLMVGARWLAKRLAYPPIIPGVIRWFRPTQPN